jgi:hypothetical protein
MGDLAEKLWAAEAGEALNQADEGMLAERVVELADGDESMGSFNSADLSSKEYENLLDELTELGARAPNGQAARVELEKEELEYLLEVLRDVPGIERKLARALATIKY